MTLPVYESRWVILGKGTKPKRMACRCACGTEREVYQSQLKNGTSLSCGCLAREATTIRQKTHGQYGTPEYTTWIQLRARCNNKKSRLYADYGGRGIGVCSRWQDDFESFLMDMGERPGPKHSIDRIDNNKGYWCGHPFCPECGSFGRQPNCWWATKKQQSRNTRATVFIEYGGQRKSVAEWAEVVGVRTGVLVSRIKCRGPMEALRRSFSGGYK